VPKIRLGEPGSDQIFFARRSSRGISPQLEPAKRSTETKEKIIVILLRGIKAMFRLTLNVDSRSQTSNLTHNSPKYLEWNSAEEKLKGFIQLKYSILSFGKCLNN